MFQIHRHVLCFQCFTDLRSDYPKLGASRVGSRLHKRLARKLGCPCTRLSAEAWAVGCWPLGQRPRAYRRRDGGREVWRERGTPLPPFCWCWRSPPIVPLAPGFGFPTNPQGEAPLAIGVCIQGSYTGSIRRTITGITEVCPQTITGITWKTLFPTGEGVEILLGNPHLTPPPIPYQRHPNE